ncbi:DUF4406 domain-containing protein [Candidatus Woesearchaeota archaeon]|nr:DUF4406 domain-containing protein [Candidatus Woesearchaeota archaeon]
MKYFNKKVKQLKVEQKIRKGLPLRIYVAGPYTDKNPIKKAENVSLAEKVALEIQSKGHFFYLPHKMTEDWEHKSNANWEYYIDLHAWHIQFYDAIYIISSSPGTDVEEKMAKEKGLKIYKSLDEIPIFKK